MAELLGADLIPLGSAGAKVAAVLQGQADAYVHAGGQYEWDSAAPVAVARAAGFRASRIDGRELSYNQPDLFMPDILVCPPALAGALLDAIQVRPVRTRPAAVNDDGLGGGPSPPDTIPVPDAFLDAVDAYRLHTLPA